MKLDLVNDIQQQDKNALKQLNQRKQLTVPLLASLLGIGETKAKRILQRLCSKDYCHQVRVKNRIYYKEGTSPVIVNPPRYTPTGKFIGVVWKPEISRPGCQDFLNCPSRVNDRFEPHRPMIHALV